MKSLYCSTQVIGKATVHTPIEQKREAQRVGASNIREMEQEKETSEK